MTTDVTIIDDAAPASTTAVVPTAGTASGRGHRSLDDLHEALDRAFDLRDQIGRLRTAIDTLRDKGLHAELRVDGSRVCMLHVDMAVPILTGRIDQMRGEFADLCRNMGVDQDDGYAEAVEA